MKISLKREVITIGGKGICCEVNVSVHCALTRLSQTLCSCVVCLVCMVATVGMVGMVGMPRRPQTTPNTTVSCERPIPGS